VSENAFEVRKERFLGQIRREKGSIALSYVAFFATKYGPKSPLYSQRGGRLPLIEGFLSHMMVA